MKNITAAHVVAVVAAAPAITCLTILSGLQCMIWVDRIKENNEKELQR